MYVERVNRTEVRTLQKAFKRKKNSVNECIYEQVLCLGLDLDKKANKSARISRPVSIFLS